jgi:hypothetical protein
LKKETLNNTVFGSFKCPPWPSFVKPQPDELFSSWLLRMSRSHLLRYYSFCSSYFEGIGFWDRDLDKFLPEGIKDIVVNKSILKIEDINQMLLSSFYPNLYIGDLSSRNPWFTPFSVYSHKYGAKHSTTLSICPSCLNKDEDQPYFRKNWRLSIQTICENCRCDMIDRCPNCGVPINHLISERGRKNQMSIFPITYCWKCLYDLKSHPTIKPTEELLNMQGFLNTTIELGYDISHSLHYSHLYFSVLKKTLSLLNKAKNQQLQKLQELICNATNLEFITPSNSRENPFEMMSIDKRRNLLFKAYWLLGDWPNRFRELTTKAGLKSKLFTDDFQEIPYWFKSEIINNRIVYAEWRKHYPDFSYGSFKEFAFWRVSKMIQAKDPNLKRGQY